MDITRSEIRLILFFAAKDGETLYSQQKQDQELTVVQIMNSLFNETAWEIVKAYLTTDFEGGRHLNRIKKIDI